MNLIGKSFYFIHINDQANYTFASQRKAISNSQSTGYSLKALATGSVLKVFDTWVF